MKYFFVVVLLVDLYLTRVHLSSFWWQEVENVVISRFSSAVHLHKNICEFKCTYYKNNEQKEDSAFFMYTLSIIHGRNLGAEFRSSQDCTSQSLILGLHKHLTFYWAYQQLTNSNCYIQRNEIYVLINYS